MTCGDMTSDRRAHTRAGGAARRETDSATAVGTAGSLAAGCTCGHNRRRAGFEPWRGRPADARRWVLAYGRRVVARRAPAGAGPQASGRVAATSESRAEMRTASGPPAAGSPQHSANRRATHAPSIAGHRDLWRGGARPCVERVPVTDGHSAAAAECGAHAVIIATLSMPKAHAASGSLTTRSRRRWGVYAGTAGLLSLLAFPRQDDENSRVRLHNIHAQSPDPRRDGRLHAREQATRPLTEPGTECCVHGAAARRVRRAVPREWRALRRAACPVSSHAVAAPQIKKIASTIACIIIPAFLMQFLWRTLLVRLTIGGATWRS